MLKYSFLTLVPLAVVAVAARAQERVRVRAPERTFMYHVDGDSIRVDLRRGRMGITVDLRPDPARDSIGARVAGVTPGGPADHAGVRTGDLITRFNGTPVTASDNGRGGDDQSRPGIRLINLASRLQPGDTVRLDLRRDGRPLSVSLEAAQTDMDVIVERMREPGGFMREFSPGMPGPEMRVFVNGPNVGDLELVNVSPQLAEGLGISQGLLVVDVGSDSALGLRAGDVITAIGGRHPTSPSHAMRILSTYDPGETIQFDVMRQRRRVTVNGRMPEPHVGTWRIRPNSFEFNMPRMDAEPMRRFFEMRVPPDIDRLRERIRAETGGADTPDMVGTTART